jgi:hypothetical protein
MYIMEFRVLMHSVITQFWVIPQKSIFSKKNKIKSWQRGESKPGNQTVIFGGNSRPNCTPLCSRMEKNANSRSN